MLETILNGVSGAWTIKQGLENEINETPENDKPREINNSEGVEYSEGDIERIEAASDVMQEIFTDEVISNWENLSVEERAAYLNEYYAKAGEALGIDTKGVYVADLQSMYGYGVQGVNAGDGYLGIDITLVEDPSRLEDLLNTTTHEMRHQLQNDALRNPDAFPDIPQETLDQWQYEMDNYIDGSYDFEAYEAQAIETDARAFAEEVVNDYLSDVDDSTYSMVRDESEIPAGIVADGEEATDRDGLMSVELNGNADGVAAMEEATDVADGNSEAEQMKSIEGSENHSVNPELNKGKNPMFYNGPCAQLCLKCKVEVGYNA